MSDWIVENRSVIGTSPIVLPYICAKCGRPSDGGTRYRYEVFWYPGWIWLGVIWGVIPMVLLYYASRRRAIVELSLCPDHVAAIRKRRLAGIALIAAFVAAIVTAIRWQLFWDGAVAIGLLVVGAVTLSFARPPVRATDHDEGVFALVGFGRGFFAAVCRDFPLRCVDGRRGRQPDGGR